MPLTRVITSLLISSMVFLLCSFRYGPSQLERIKTIGELRVSIIPSPSHYIVDEGIISGIEYQIIRDFADELQVGLKLVQVNNFNDTIQFLKQGKIHIGIPGSYSLQHQGPYNTSHSYKETEWYLLYNREDEPPRKLGSIRPNRLLVPTHSRASSILDELKIQQPGLRWIAHPEFNTSRILELINEHGYFYTLLDSDSLIYFQRIYPKLKKAFSIGTAKANWIFSDRSDNSLLELANRYLEKISKNNTIQNYRHKFLQSNNKPDYLDLIVFLKRIRTLLPKYRYYFEGASLRTSVDWRMLAAMSYQESHWNRKAQSFTGVRGLMMLTQSTAHRLGIHNRLDPQSSISGGAEYLALLIDSLPERIPSPDRIWLALAAYNIGLGHLEDARVLAARSGKNPDKWDDVKEMLPLLSQEKWYQHTKHGYARGNEPVAFVEHIRQYYDILRLYLVRHSYADLKQPELILHSVLTINSPAL